MSGLGRHEDETNEPEVVLIRGVPDSGVATVRWKGFHQEPGLTLPGTASFLAYAPGLWSQREDLWLGPPARKAGARLYRRPVVNYLADPDHYAVALKQAADYVRATGCACFNHPEAVLRTGRAEVSALLADVAGVDMPRTIVTRAASGKDLAAQIAAAGLSYPVLVRPAGSHGGVDLQKVDGPEALGDRAWAALVEGRYYVTEFREFADADGLYRKQRLVVVGREVFLRHVLVGESWLLHAERRTVNTEAEEARRLAAFRDETAPRVAPALAQIADRLGLDYFGVDCALLEDGRLLVFEANACMNVLHNSRPSPNIWDAPIHEIRDALVALLRQPHLWRRALAAAAA